MKLKQALTTFATILENGPLGTRLKYDYGFDYSSDFSGNPALMQALTDIYRSDIEAAKAQHLPIIINAPTFRASLNHIQKIGLASLDDVKRINVLSIQLLNQIKKTYSEETTSPIFIGAPLGAMFDAYSVHNAPSIQTARNYHQIQIDVFKTLEIDFINAVTLPSLNEAIGIAEAAEEAGVEYTIGFILNNEGLLLDGKSLSEAIMAIDALTAHKPLGYLVTCTHPSIIKKLINTPLPPNRLIGIQPNGSALEPAALAKLTHPIADSPEQFTESVLALKHALKLKIIAGCCGTTNAHLASLAQACAGEVSGIAPSSNSLKV